MTSWTQLFWDGWLVVRVGKGSPEVVQVLLPIRVHFLRDAADRYSVFSESVCFFDVASCPSSLWCPKWWRSFLDLFDFLGRLPQGIASGFCWCETLQECSDAIISVVNAELFVFLCCCAKYLLLFGVRSRCQPPRSLLFSSIFCIIAIGQSCALSMSVCSGVVFQPAHCTVSLKNLTAASISSSVLR
jgi:hypothetical protein